jgi:C4-dicarboxylate-specific signal transduction histidine kinase
MPTNVAHLVCVAQTTVAYAKHTLESVRKQHAEYHTKDQADEALRQAEQDLVDAKAQLANVSEMSHAR